MTDESAFVNKQICIVTFNSIHYVIKAETRLKAAGIWNDMVPNPRKITSDCGMAIVFLCSDIAQVIEKLKENDFSFNIYRRDGDSFNLISEDECGEKNSGF